MKKGPEPESMVAENADRNDAVLAGLRVAVGLLFVIFGEYKVFGTEFTLDGGFERWIHGFLSRGAYPFMVPVLRDFVLPHATAIAFLVAYGELAIGLALVFGVLARVASAFGLLYMLALLLSSDYPGPAAAFWHYLGGALEHLVPALCFAAFVTGDAERALSLRTYLHRRRRPPERP